MCASSGAISSNVLPCTSSILPTWRTTILLGSVGRWIYSAVSGIEQALWDIAGKRFGVPVYNLGALSR